MEPNCDWDYSGLNWGAIDRTLIEKLTQHSGHDYPCWEPAQVRLIRELGRIHCHSLPSELAHELRTLWWRDVQWGLRNRMIMEYRVLDHSQPRWAIVTESGCVVTFRLSTPVTLTTYFTPQGDVPYGGLEGRRDRAARYLVCHNFPPGLRPGTWVFPDPGWIKHCDGHRNPEVRGCYRILNPPGFGFARGQPGELYQRPE